MTTVSIINPEVTYREAKTIDEEDIGYKSQVYELDIESGITITVVIGKPKYIYTDKNIIFFPIYAIHRSHIRSQIGVFEVKSAQLINVYKNGELDLRRLSEPLYYSFSKPVYLAKLEAEPKFFKDRPLTPTPKEVPRKDLDLYLDANEPDDHLELRLGKTATSKAQADAKQALERGVFEPVDGFKPRPPLDEETKETAAAERKEYKESSRNVWIEKFMRNHKYRIHEVESNGDCLFAVIRDAFADIGRRTTVDKLRSILATEMTDNVYNEYRTVYLSFLDELQTLKRDLAATEKTLKQYQKRAKQITDKTTADGKEMVNQSKALEQERQNIKKKIADTESVKTLYTGDISEIDTLEKMRRHIKTTRFWADTWAISTLERVLNIKLLIFSQQAYEQENGNPDLDGTFLCGEVNKELQERQTFNPDFYIMTTYSGNHYRLISYKSRKIFQFREVPYDVKIIVLNRCLSRLSGVYYMIQDFRDLKTKFGIDEDEGAPDDHREREGYGSLFNDSAVFVFCSNSDSKMKPGEGNGEKLAKTEVAKYAKLHTKFYAWRKKLDDDWGDKSHDPIVIDGHKWTSVTHYMQGVQYKRTHPDVYLMFSLDSDPDSELAKSAKKAKEFKGIVKEAIQSEPNEKASKKPLKNPKKQLQVISADLDFDEKRREEEREKALKSKFENNDTMRMLLHATGDALLIHNCGSGLPAMPDMELMRTRESVGR